MHMAQHTRRWTRRDLDRLPDDGNRYEVVRGELFVTPAPRPAHDAIVMALAERLTEYVGRIGLGQVASGRPALVVEDSQVEPDLVVRPRVRPVPAEWKDMPAPLLVVDVLSDTTARRDRIAKRTLYLEATVPDYWIVDAEGRLITVVRPGQPDETVGDRLRWLPSAATEPFEMDVAAMFRDALD